MKPKAVFVGRFQPFHKGHLSAILALLKKYRVIICIGSAQASRTDKNPFTALERERMIRASLREASVRGIRIIKLKDSHSDKKWAKTLVRKTGRIHAVATGNSLVSGSLTGAKIITIKKKYNISATEIRALMRAGKSWEKLVSAAEVPILRKIYVNPQRG